MDTTTSTQQSNRKDVPMSIPQTTAPPLARPGSSGDVAHWRACAVVAIDRLAYAGRPFTAADVTHAVGTPCPCSSMLGGLLGAAHRRGRLVLVGAVVDTRPSGTVVATRQWVGTAEAAA